jgi:diguanylate cyclase (GGDEF)-like protein
MTTERANRSGTAARASVASYLRRAETLVAVESRTPAPSSTVSATVFGISEGEFTPRVRDAVMKLMGEVDSLNGELIQLRSRLERAEREADQDQLLPVLNRRAFVRELTRHIALAGRYGTPASVVYFDLDDFKLINDTYGHPGGDAVLAHFAQTLTDNVRESDVVGRLGGDEFAVILTHAGQDQANRKAQGLIDALSTQPANYNGQVLPVGVSFGAFELKAGENAEAAMARADEAMYCRKRAAR